MSGFKAGLVEGAVGKRVVLTDSPFVFYARTEISTLSFAKRVVNNVLNMR